MAELESLLNQEIPNGKKALLDGKANLESVANYCQQVYADSTDKKAALEETKNFATQSLASVAYQINTLASNMLHMLDIQQAELASMESSINNISLTVDIHKEKVARREIGLLTTSQAIPRNHQIVAPSNPDRVLKYVRKPIDFTELDDIGHGVKLANQQGQGNSSGRRTLKTQSPSIDGRKRDSMKSVTSSTGYGTIRAVRTPTVPTDFNSTKRLPSMHTSHHHARTNSNSSSGSGSMSSSGGYYSSGPGPTAQHAPPPAAMPPPPVQGPPPPPTVPGVMPPPPPSVMHPPPPMEGAPPPPPPPSIAPPPPPPPMSPGYSTPSAARIPAAPGLPPPAEGYASTAVFDAHLPPPPPLEADVSELPPPPPIVSEVPLPLPDDSMMPPPPPDDLPSPYSNHDDSSGAAGSNYGSSDPVWAPKSYIQKVIAIYDYCAENSDELSLREDEIVYVVRINDDGWYEGVLNGATGLFPGNYVETISA